MRFERKKMKKILLLCISALGVLSACTTGREVPTPAPGGGGGGGDIHLMYGVKPVEYKVKPHVDNDSSTSSNDFELRKSSN